MFQLSFLLQSIYNQKFVWGHFLPPPDTIGLNSKNLTHSLEKRKRFFQNKRICTDF